MSQNEWIKITKLYTHLVYLSWPMIYTHYYKSNLIWTTVSCQVDEVMLSDLWRREASRMILCMTSSTRHDTVLQNKLLVVY